MHSGYGFFLLVLLQTYVAALATMLFLRKEHHGIRTFEVVATLPTRAHTHTHTNQHVLAHIMVFIIVLLFSLPWIPPAALFQVRVTAALAASAQCGHIRGHLDTGHLLPVDDETTLGHR